MALVTCDRVAKEDRLMCFVALVTCKNIAQSGMVLAGCWDLIACCIALNDVAAKCKSFRSSSNLHKLQAT
jgi:hypothetical protein